MKHGDINIPKEEFKNGMISLDIYDKLKTERDQIFEQFFEMTKLYLKTSDELNSLQSENAKLREALEGIENLDQYGMSLISFYSKVRDIARAALKKGDE